MAVDNISGNASYAPNGGWSGVVAGAASGIIGGSFGLGSTALSYKYNKRLAEQQNQYNIDMWKMTNDYNSPSAQMRRFEEAGLNPLLIYGQGSHGNASSPPQMVTPEAPKFDKAAQELAKAFNIENLLTIHAKRKQAEEEAGIARQNNLRLRAQNLADSHFFDNYLFDAKTGRFVPQNDPVVHVFKDPAGGVARGMMMQRLADNYRFNSLISPRASLIGYQQQLVDAQRKYLMPQIMMSTYESKYFPVSFWIGQGTKVLNSLPLPKLNFGWQRKSFNYNGY